MKNKITLPIVSAVAVILMILLLFLTVGGEFLSATVIKFRISTV